MKKQLYLIIVALLLVIGTSIFTSVSYSKYLTNQTNGSSNVAVAAPIFILSSLTHSSNLQTYTLNLENINPTQTHIYNFQITNHSGLSISEIAMDYTISLSSTGNLPINISLKKAGVLMGRVTYSPSSLSLSSDIQQLNAGTAQTDNYTLEIVWNNSFTSSNYSNLIDALSISIDWRQRD